MTLSVADYAALRAPTSRHRLWCVPFSTFQARTYTTIAETNSVQTVALVDWKPVLNIGPHRLAFVGEAISFDASGSYNVGEGSGAGTVTGGSWTFSSADITTASGVGPHAVSWSTPGLYQVTYSNGGQSANRWVRVLANRDSAVWDVTAIGNCGGNLDVGWTASITISPNDDDGTAVAVADYQCIGLFAEDEWDQGSGFAVRPVGGCGGDPRVVMIGYVREGSISRDHQTHSVTFTLESIGAQLARTQIHKTACWQGTVPSVFGAFFQGLSSMKITHPVLWLLQFKTNVLAEHDFHTFWNTDLQSLETIEGQEAPVWSVLDAWAQASFTEAYCDAGNAIRFAPDRQVTVDVDWDLAFPTAIDFTDDLMLQATAQQNKQRNIIYVQLTMTDTKKMKSATKSYPLTLPSGPGQWIVRKDLLGSDAAWLADVALRVYNVGNRIWNVTLSLPQNRAPQPGDLVTITTTLADAGETWTAKRFVVDSVSYEITPQAGTWKTTAHLLEDMR